MRRKYIDERFGNYLPRFYTDGSMGFYEGREARGPEQVKGDEGMLSAIYQRDDALLDFIFNMCQAFSEAAPEAFAAFYYRSESEH